MPVPTAYPNRVLRVGFTLLAVALLLVAVWASLARALFPLLNEYRPELERALREVLGHDIRIGKISGDWLNVSAQFFLQDVEIRDGEQALYLEQLRLVPAIWRSLYQQQLQFERISLEGLQLAVRQKADGQWQLKGLRESPYATSSPDLQTLWRLLQHLPTVTLTDARLTVEPWQRDAFTLNDIDAQLDPNGSTLQLQSRWRLPDGQPISLRVDAAHLDADWQQASAKFYVDIPNTDWAAWLSGLRLPDVGEWVHLQAGGQLWLEWDVGSIQRAALRVAAPAMSVRGEHQSAAFNDIALSAWLTKEAHGWHIQTSVLNGQFAGRDVSVGALEARYNTQTSAWSMQVEKLNLSPLNQLVTQLAPLPPLARELLSTLAPHGQLHDAQVQIQPREQGLPDVSYRLGLQQVGTSPWHDVPGFDNISGELEGNLHGGELRLDAQGFSLYLNQLFPEAWRYETAKARLQWQLDERAFTLSSRLMQLSGEEGELAGNMLIRLFHHDPNAESYMDLQVGLRNGDARFTSRYLPTRLTAFSPALADWLKTAIRRGRIEQGVFIYQGALSAHRPETARALALYFALNEAELAYQPEWPPLSNIRGEVFVEDDSIRVLAPSARAWDSQLQQVDARIDRLHHPLRLQVSGNVQSSMVDGLKILQDTPLGRDKTFLGWKGEGALSGDVQLDIPLDGKTPLRAKVGFAAENARLQLPIPTLDIQAIKGRFLYDSARGLSANSVQAQIFGQPVRGRLVANGRDGVIRSQLQAEGAVEVSRLARWLGVTETLPVTGRLPYRLAVDVQGEERMLSVKSSLQGVNVDLPAPFGKDASTARDSQWQMNLTGREQRYRFSHANLLNMEMAFPNERPEKLRAEVRLGGEAASLPNEPGWRIAGNVSRLDVLAWQAFLKRYAGSSASARDWGVLRSLQISAENAQLGAVQVSPLALDWRPQAEGWQLQLEGPELKGQLFKPNQAGVPWAVQIQRLHLPAKEKDVTGVSSTSTADPLAAIDPRQFPAMDVRIDNVWQGTDRLGRWEFQARPQANGVTFNKLNLDLRGLKLGGQLDWQGNAAAMRTHYSGVLSGADASDVLLAWGFAPSLSSEEFRLGVDGSWSGSPAQAGLRNFSGSLDLRANNGQVLAVEGGALRVFGIFNFDALRRRLRFDFSDLFGKGLGYDRIRGRLQGTDGVFLTTSPLTLEGPSTRLELDGQLDAVNEQMASRLRVMLPLSNNLPVAALLAGALPVAGALLVVDRLVGDHLSKVASVEYRVDGPWQNPQISPFGKPSTSVPMDTNLE